MSDGNIVFLVLMSIITMMFGAAALYAHFLMEDKDTKTEED